MSVFNLPDLGEGLHDAEIVTWHVKPGDAVKSGDTLVSVETDKAGVDIPSPGAGTVVRTHGAPGEHLAVGAPLVEFADGGGADAGALVGRLPTGNEAPARARQPSPPPAAAARVMATPAVSAPLTRLPNALTVARLGLIPVFVALMVRAGHAHSWPAGIVFGVAGATDQVDGFLARYHGLRDRLPGDLATRDAAAEAFRRAGLPGRRVEAWKYTDLRPVAAVSFAEPLTPLAREQRE